MASSISSAITQANNEFNTVVGQQNSGANLDKNAFMLLLVTQFKYQDPLNPMDDKEFVSQMAQFSSLEQLINLNTSMTSLTTATNNEQMINATSYIGKEVTISGNSIGKAETRSRMLSRKLREVEALPVPEAERLIGGQEIDLGGEDD